jgi:hypothetical protein
MTRILIVAATVLVSACNPGAREARELAASCSGGDAAACNELGQRVSQGQYVLRDWRRTAELFQDACDGGESEGCVRLARMHVHSEARSRGVALDSALAATLLLLGCDGGAMVG